MKHYLLRITFFVLTALLTVTAVAQTVQTGRVAAATLRAAAPIADDEVQALLAEREAARAGRNWAETDRLRDSIARLGWRVLDTAGGQRIEPL